MCGSRVRAATAERDELRAVADAQDQRLRLARGKGEAEQALVELEGPADVGHGQRHVIPGVDRNGRAGGAARQVPAPRRRGGAAGVGLAGRRSPISAGVAAAARVPARNDRVGSA